MKKLLLILLGVLAALPSFALDFTYPYEGQTLKYTVLDDGVSCEVASNTGGIRGEVKIPSTVSYNDVSYTVTSIGEKGFSTCVRLTSVEIPNTVTSIGESAFDNCSSLTSVEIPNTVTSIGEFAFAYCSSLTSIEIPNSVTSIGEFAFAYCSSLTSIEIPNSVTSIGEFAFGSCSNLTDVYYNAKNCDFINSIFQGSPIKTVVLGSSVESIGESAFSECSSLESVVLSNSLTTINESVFSGCSSLTSVEIPTSVTSIGNYAFQGCSSLTSIEIPNTVKEIGFWAFVDCISLESVVLSNSLTKIDERVFSGCSSLTSVEIPNSVTELRYGAFQNCSSLTSIEIPNSVTSIGRDAFRYNSNLTTVVIGSSVESIGEYAFSDCTAIETVTCLSTKPCQIDYNTFSEETYSNATLILPDGCKANYDDSEWQLFRKIEDNSVTVEYTYQGQTLSYTVILNDSRICKINSNNSIEGNLIIPPVITYNDVEYTVTSISDNAFSGCSGLTSVEIPNSVTSIGEGAFSYCSSLTSVEIPNSVTSISQYAFFSCSSLTSVEIMNPAIYIGFVAFSNCPLTSFYITKDMNISVLAIGESNWNERVTEVTVEEGRESVDLAWFGNIKSLKLPDSVTTLEYNYDEEINIGRYELGNGLTSIPEGAFSNTNAVFINSLNPPTLEDGVFGGNDPKDILAVVPYEAKSAYRNNDMWSQMTILDEVTGSVTVNLNGEESLSVALYNQTGTMPVNVLKLKITGDITEADWEQFRANMIHCIELDLSEATSELFPNLDRNSSLPFECQYFPQGVKTVNYHTLPVVKAIPETVEVIGDNAFADAIFEGDITIPSGVRYIGAYAFANTELTEVQIPEGCEYIREGCFSNTQLSTVTIPDNITAVPGNSFADCRNLTSVSLGKNVESIGYGAFSHTQLTAIELPASVNVIEDGAFQNTPLTWITSLNPVPPVLAEGFNTAMNYQKCVLSIPSDSFFDYLQASVWGRFAVLDGRLDFSSDPGAETSCSQTSGTEPAEMRRRIAAKDADEEMMQVVNGQAILLEDGSMLRFKISPVGNSTIVKVTFNDEDVTDQLVDGYYTTPAISGRASLKVETKEGAVETPEAPVAKVGDTILSTESVFESAEAVDVTLSCATEGAEIYYLLIPTNSTEPKAEGEYTLYSAPVKVDANAKLSVYAALEGVKSEINTYTLEINTETGVAVTIADLEDAEIYTLQGLRVTKPEAGHIYIVRKDGRTYKVMAR